MEPVCYYIGRWDGKDFLFAAEVNTLELAETVAEITGLEILSDNDADSVDNFIHVIRDYFAPDKNLKRTEKRKRERHDD